jgi:hypothetical protein
MFSMPLTYPSTLDRRPPAAHIRRASSYVEGRWSPIMARQLIKPHAKAQRIFLAQFPARSTEIFLSQAGPRFDLELGQAEHHLGSDVDVCAFRNKEGDPLGSPSFGLLCG